MKTQVKVAQTFRWEMGHRLPYHTGGCQNLHGHSYKMIVEVEGEVNEQGMVVDLFDIRDLVTPVVQQLDHAFLCSQNDTLMVEFLKNVDFKVVYVDFYSTVENIARYILEQIAPKFQKLGNVHGITVRVYETPQEYAEVKVIFGEQD